MKSYLAAVVIFGMLASSVDAAPVTFRAGLIKGDGAVRPVARQDFTFIPTSVFDTKDEYLALSHKLGLSEPQLEAFHKPVEGMEELLYEIDIESFNASYKHWIDKVLKASFAPKDRRSSVTIKTNLDGRAKLDLPEGNWIVSGKYKDNFTSEHWARKITIGQGDNEIELSNDNSDPNFWFPSVPEIEEKQEYHVTETGQAYAATARWKLMDFSKALDSQSSFWLLAGLGSSVGAASAAAVAKQPDLIVPGLLLTPVVVWMLSGVAIGATDPVSGIWTRGSSPEWSKYGRLARESDVAIIQAVRNEPALEKALGLAK